MENQFSAVPQWVETIAVISLVLGIVCMVIVIADIAGGHRQKMWIMNIVWPVTMLYSSLIGLRAYFSFGRKSKKHTDEKKGSQTPMSEGSEKPFWQVAAVGATHCGSGCTVGDVLAETFIAIAPFTLFGMKIFGAWLVDYILAFLFGIAFQYFSIQPIKHLPVRKGLAAALKADTLSLTAWQIGMYGWMAIVVFAVVGHELGKTDPFFWFMMQIAMLFGFATSFPVNWWLIKKGVKEKM